MSKIDYNALEQVTDTTWGRSSTPLSHSTSVKVKLIGECEISITYASIVNFRTNNEYIQTKARENDGARQIISQVVSNIKKNYKILTGQTIKIKETNSQDSIEIIGLAVHNSNKRACYRLVNTFEIA